MHVAVRGELERGTGRLRQLVHQRSALLLNAAEVLVADFGFRSAIASGDTATILSALDNNVGRIDADLAHLIDLDGRLVARSSVSLATESGALSAGEAGRRDVYRRLATKAETDGRVLDTIVLDGHARQVVMVPVKAPLTVGWLLLGFSLDDALARELGSQIDMQVSFASGSPDSPNDAANIRAFHGSTLSLVRRRALPAAMTALAATEAGATSSLAGESFLTREVDIGDRPGAVSAILQSSLDEALAGYRELRRRLILLGVAFLGIALSIDDFGTGYSSLAKLRDLPIDELKIDRAFVTGLEADSVEALIVRTVIELGHGLGLTIVTEGVETEAEPAIDASGATPTVDDPALAGALPDDTSSKRSGSVPTLYDELGGADGVAALSENFIRAIAADDRVRGHYRDSDIGRFDRMVQQQICERTGGGCTYSGDDMRRTHGGMNITPTEFNAIVEALMNAMDTVGLPVATQNRLLELYAPMRADIIDR